MNLQELENKTILLFGKSRTFRDEEFDSQMQQHKIRLVKEYEESVILVIDGKMMTPYEQNESERLYETKELKFISIDELEVDLAQQIDEDTLLMSLKLSHDKERLKSFIQNSMVSDRLFFRLLKMYSWGDEDFFENDDNRDVSAAYISRFYENIERNHNVQYATTGFIHLVAQTKDAELLREIARLKPLKFHPKIDAAIAMSPYCDSKLQKSYLQRGESKILEALSCNSNLDESLVEGFLNDTTLGSNVAQHIALNMVLFEKFKIYMSSLALNETLSLTMQNELLNLKNRDVNYALAHNNNLDKRVINELLSLKDEKIQQRVYENSATSVEILQEAYKDEKNYAALAKNESTPIEILYQLQLDSRYERSVKTNAGFGRHIQTQNIGWL